MMTNAEPVAERNVPAVVLAEVPTVAPSLESFPENSCNDVLEDWVIHINSEWEQSVMSIVETGRLLLEAEQVLLRGEWQALITSGRLHFSRETAFRLMKIARHPVLSNVTHVQRLPPSWGTLYELTKLPIPRLKTYMERGLITSEMTRAQAIDLIMPPRPRGPERSPRRRYQEGLDEHREECVELRDPECPEEFPLVDESIEYDFECPRCYYCWSGKPKP